MILGDGFIYPSAEQVSWQWLLIVASSSFLCRKGDNREWPVRNEVGRFYWWYGDWPMNYVRQGRDLTGKVPQPEHPISACALLKGMN